MSGDFLDHNPHFKTDELLPCPFCGTAPKIQSYADGVHEFIQCDNVSCATKPETDGYSVLSMAITAWNTRALSEPQAEGWLIPFRCMNQLQKDSFEKMVKILSHGGIIDVVARIDGKDYRWEFDALSKMRKI